MPGFLIVFTVIFSIVFKAFERASNRPARRQQLKCAVFHHQLRRISNKTFLLFDSLFQFPINSGLDEL